MGPEFFDTPAEFRQRPEEQHDKEIELWVGFFGKASENTGVNYKQALDEALCYGCIDGIPRIHWAVFYAKIYPKKAQNYLV